MKPCPSLQFPDLASFLLARASRSTQLANYFYWYLSVECSEGKDRIKYEKIRLKFLEDLKNVSCDDLTYGICSPSRSVVHVMMYVHVYIAGWHTWLMWSLGSGLLFSQNRISSYRLYMDQITFQTCVGPH